ncbi:MAG TPA: hemolysin family protein [Rubricoccaceae bacterium]|jgi:putative hemolysin
MSSTAFQALLIFALIVLNGVFSMSELAVVSSKKARLRQRADEGDRGARAAAELAEDPNTFLATVQVGISLVGIFAGAYGGNRLAAPLADALAGAPVVGPYAEGLALALVVLAITYLSLVVGELVPKRIALNNPERIAAAIARPMGVVSLVATPLVWVLSKSTEGLFRLLRLREKDDAAATEEEIGFLLHEGTEAGVIDTEEQRIVERVFRFGDQTVGGVMTPRRDVVALDFEDSPDELRAAVLASSHVRLVACRGGLDHIEGIVDVRDVLGRVLDGAPFDPAAAAQPVRFVPEHAPALRVLQTFRETGDKVAVVIDEYGGTAGLVALDDILEALVGALPGAGDRPGHGIVCRDDGAFEVHGGVLVEDLQETAGVRLAAGDDRGDYRTVAGWVVSRLGRIPEPGDVLDDDALRVEVVEMDGPRVDRLLVTLRERT